MIHIKNKKRGFSLVEILVALGIFSVIVVLIGTFQADIFSLNEIIQVGLNNTNEAKKIIRPFSNEVRSATLSDNGSYPILQADSTNFIFYSDIDGDGEREQVRYFLENGVFKKGITNSSGNPKIYNPNDEDIIQVVKDVVNSEIFTYFDSSYDGQEFSEQLSFPVSVSSIRLIKIELVIDSNPDKPPAAVTVSTQVSIRNLKDNHDS